MSSMTVAFVRQNRLKILLFFIVVICQKDARVLRYQSNTQRLPGNGEREDPEVRMNTCQLVTSKGYKCEEHKVQTQDGYILTVHRMPYVQSSSPIRGQPVFLLHGLISASSDWVINLANESFGYMLANAGYDVWMGNVRGNTYSCAHVKLAPGDPRFWEFSWDEMAKYDVPAMIDYVLQHTGHKKLFYVGHSQGTTVAFARLSQDPELNEKIEVFFGLAPVATIKDIKGAFKVLNYFTPEIKALVELLGFHEFLPHDVLIDFLARTVCALPTRAVCREMLFLLCGYDTSNFNSTRLPVYLTHTPAGTSVQNMVHWTQMANSGKFQAFDYGSPDENEKHYGQVTPPLYPLQNITVPVVLLSSQNDWLADPEDVRRLVPRLQHIIKHYKFQHFNHLDFVWGLDAAPAFYDKILRIMKRRTMSGSRNNLKQLIHV